MRRFSIRALLTLVCLVAVWLAALRTGDELWIGVLLVVVLAALVPPRACFAENKLYDDRPAGSEGES